MLRERDLKERVLNLCVMHLYKDFINSKTGKTNLWWKKFRALVTSGGWRQELTGTGHEETFWDNRNIYTSEEMGRETVKGLPKEH